MLVNHDFGNLPALIHAKVDFGTDSALAGNAMSIDKAKAAVEKGK